MFPFSKFGLDLFPPKATVTVGRYLPIPTTNIANIDVAPVHPLFLESWNITAINNIILSITHDLEARYPGSRYTELRKR